MLIYGSGADTSHMWVIALYGNNMQIKCSSIECQMFPDFEIISGLFHDEPPMIECHVMPIIHRHREASLGDLLGDARERSIMR